MKLVAIALAAFVGMAHGASNEFETYQAMVQDKLKDGDSARFRNMRYGALQKGGVCGEVNAKNSYGGYVGFAPFVIVTRNVILISKTDGSYDGAYQSVSDAIGC